MLALRIMSILSPYLQGRGDTFSFRIAIPSELRHLLGKREFIKSLRTTDKRVAVVKALMLTATAKQSVDDAQLRQRSDDYSERQQDRQRNEERDKRAERMERDYDYRDRSEHY